MRTLLASEHPSGALLGLTSAATAVTLVACLVTPSVERPRAILIPASPAPATTPVPAAPKPAPKPAPDPRAGELLFAFRAGQATYVRLASLHRNADDEATLAVPRHGRLRMVEDDNVRSVIASVALRDVPAAYAAWNDRTIKVDRTCEAKVVSFAVVSRLIGDVSYAGEEQDAWDAALVMESGAPVLAAKLSACDGTYARDAALPDPILPELLHDASLEAAGRAALLASSLAAATQREWDDQLRDVNSPPRAWAAEPDALTTQVLRHPVTHETFVSVHGHVSAGCGDPHANIWALYRVDGQTLTPIQLRGLGDLESIDTLIDIDNDGTFELLGKPWLGNTQLLTKPDGTAIDQLDLPFYGCPC